MTTDKNMKRFSLFLNMNSTKEQELFIYINDEAGGNVSKFLKEMVENRKNGTTTNSIELKDKKLEVEIRLKETQIKINERRLLYYDTFGNSPSLSAKRSVEFYLFLLMIILILQKVKCNFVITISKSTDQYLKD